MPENYILDTEHQHITLEPNRIGTVQFQNHQRPTLVINKVDLNGKALTGAIFELKTKAGVKIGDFPVDANGKVTISNVHLTEGYYIITETQAPAGYILDSTPHEVYLRPGKTTEISIENHIIDPDTLYPGKLWRAVTVVCPDSGLADCLSTALFLLPIEEGQKLLDECGSVAMWVDADGEIYYSTGFEELIRT